MDGLEALDRLQFKDDLPFDKKVDSVTTIEGGATVDDGQSLLSLECKAALDEFKC